MTSTYKKDLGNGVVIHADKYVKTGQWVFDCEYRRLINRKPLPTPEKELSATEKFTIGRMYALDEADRKSAKEVITATLESSNWHKNLHYLYSGLSDNSEIRYHTWYLLTKYLGRNWAIEVDQSIDYAGVSSFEVNAKPYDPETYVDYAKALQIASKSCPKPQ